MIMKLNSKLSSPKNSRFSSSLSNTLSLRSSYGLFIDGQEVPASDGATLDVQNPAFLTHVTTVACGSDADVNRAVNSSRVAFIDGRWSMMPPRNRAKVLNKAAELLTTHMATLARIESVSTGRCLREYNAQLARVPDWWE